MKTPFRKGLRAALVGALFSSALGCASSSSTAPPSSSAASSDATAATKPERAKLTLHLKEHVKYPATRAELLKACAGTSEFTAGEQKWFETNLPEGSYASADQVLAAVKP